MPTVSEKSTPARDAVTRVGEMYLKAQELFRIFFNTATQQLVPLPSFRRLEQDGGGHELGDAAQRGRFEFFGQEFTVRFACHYGAAQLMIAVESGEKWSASVVVDLNGDVYPDVGSTQKFDRNISLRPADTLYAMLAEAMQIRT